jgi:ankyrin repeat protein
MPLTSLGASILGRADRLRAVLAKGREPVAGEAGSTQLYFAARYGHADCVRILLDAGTDVNARLPSWDTPDIGPRPLAGAAIAGHADVVRLLLERGADPALLELDEEEWAQLTPEIRKLLRPTEVRRATTAPER